MGANCTKMAQIKRFLFYYLLPAVILAGTVVFIQRNLTHSKAEAIISCIICGFLLGIVFSMKIPAQAPTKE
jgi:ABC-type iron transport system FetAB permease component